MFEDCGRKLKVVAVILFVLLLIGTVVGFVFATRVDVLLALGVLIGGALVAYVTALTLYTVGEAGEGANGKAAPETEESKKIKKIDKLLDALCDN